MSGPLCLALGISRGSSQRKQSIVSIVPRLDLVRRDRSRATRRWNSAGKKRSSRLTRTRVGAVGHALPAPPDLCYARASGGAQPSIMFCNSGSMGMRLNILTSLPPVFPTGTTPTAEPSTPRTMRTACPTAATGRLRRNSTFSISQCDLAWSTTNAWPMT
jgi:hypothetical protein